MWRQLCATFVVGSWLMQGSPAVSQVTTLFEDPFDEFQVGTDWQAHRDGEPEDVLGINAPSVFLSVLEMISDGFGDETRGVETITPISLTGLTNVTVDVRLRPINQGINGTFAAAEVALLGNSGESLQASDALRRFVITVHESGTLLEILNDDESFNTSIVSSFSISDLGSEFDVALRQDTIDGGNPAHGWFDSILVTTDPNFEPPGLGGDYNGDNMVDAADYTLWRDNLGGDAAAAFAVGSRDPNNSGPINAADHTFWRNSFGDSLPGSAALQAAPVPEPTAWGLCGLGLMAFAIGRLRDRRQSGAL